MKTKIGIFFLVTIIALAGIGTSYAVWSETTEIDGQATTGNIKPVFTWYGDASFYYDNGTTCVEDTFGTASADVAIKDSGSRLRVRINNAYPWLSTLIDVTITNEGSVPMQLDNISFTPMWEHVAFGIAQTHRGRLNVAAVSRLTELGEDAELLDKVPILPGEKLKFTLVTHVLGDDDWPIPQNHVFEYDVNFEWTQWQP